MNIQNLPLEDQYQILSYLPPQDVLKLCQTNKYYQLLCNNNDFWIFRANNEFGISADEFNDTNLTPNLRYLQLLSTVGDRCVPGSEQFISENECLKRSARDNDINTLDYFLKNKNNKIYYALIGSAEGNNLNLLRKLISIYGSNNYDKFELKIALTHSIINDNVEMFIFLLNLIESANFTFYNPSQYELLNTSLYEAANNNSINIINYLDSLGFNDPNIILNAAANSNSLPLIEYAIKKGALDYNDALINAIIANNISLIDYFIDIGANNFHHALRISSEHGNLNAFQHIINQMKKLNIEINPDDVDDIIFAGLSHKGKENLNLIKYILNLPHLRVNNLSNSIKIASKQDKNNDILRYLVDKSSDFGILNDLTLSQALSSSIYNYQPINTKYLLSIGARLYQYLSLTITNNRKMEFKELFTKGLQSKILSNDEINGLLALAIANNNHDIVDFIKFSVAYP